ncbi:MAG: glycoside hydrolase family 95 protein [Treponema sp.]|jgi:alpha-L-fucosidase 2|nr:glycoside hydrolase family 95 protein [Treponema sp.]
MELWYEQEAGQWTEALPLGNGRLGAMVFGKTADEIVAVNEDSLWSGYPRDCGPKNKAGASAAIRDLAAQGRYAEAEELFEREISSTWSQSYLPLGDLLVSFGHRDVKNYRRSLDLDRALSSVSYEHEGVRYDREYFVSAPDNCIVMRFTADRPGRVSFTLAMKSQLRSACSARGGRLCLDGIAPSGLLPSYVTNADPVVYADRDEEKGMRFTMSALPLLSGGGAVLKDGLLTVEGADSAVLLVNAETSFSQWNRLPWLEGKDEQGICAGVLDRAAGKGYGAILERHVADYAAYYGRVEIDLGTSENAALPTDRRLLRFAEEKNDPALYSLLFQFGRYLLIAASRPGTQPTNLQGIWNSELRAPWSSNYTININTQMNYWPALPCALEEMQLPLVGFIRELAAAGAATAREIYGAPGWVSHHNSDLWRMTWPVGDHGKGVSVFANWNLSAGWLCEHLFERYEYTLDREFLGETAYPLMKAAAEFYTALLSDDGEGCLVLCPSTSPENCFIAGGARLATAKTTTMATAVIRELLTNCIRAAGILGIDADFAAKLSETCAKLRPFRTGGKGQLLEWDQEYEEAEPRHRHTSHLYGLHPGNQISPEKTPDLVRACKKTLELRGDDGTGWSLAWKVNFWARLRDGDHALAILNNQLRPVGVTGTSYSGGGGTYPNMFDAHPPYQIDGNFGVTAGIAEMLLQNTEDGIILLPALPGAWNRGRCRGLRAKGKLCVDIFWDGGLTRAVLRSGIDRELAVSCRPQSGAKRTVSLKAGTPLELEF